MSKPIDEYFRLKEEPVKSCLLALREYILTYDKDITEEWKYKMPFYYYNGKMFCYLWVDSSNGQPYIGICEGRQIEHPALKQDKRARMKIMFVDAERAIPVKVIEEVFGRAMVLYR